MKCWNYICHLTHLFSFLFMFSYMFKISVEILRYLPHWLPLTDHHKQLRNLRKYIAINQYTSFFVTSLDFHEQNTTGNKTVGDIISNSLYQVLLIWKGKLLGYRFSQLLYNSIFWNRKYNRFNNFLIDKENVFFCQTKILLSTLLFNKNKIYSEKKYICIMNIILYNDWR